MATLNLEENTTVQAKLQCDKDQTNNISDCNNYNSLQENTEHSDGNSDGDEICRKFMTHF